MPHDSLHDVAGAAVVQTFHTAATLSGQSATPQRRSAAPARADVVLHPEAVLYEVGVRPYLLVRIARHVAVGKEEAGRVLNVVLASGPRRTVTGGTANLREQLLALLEVLGRGVAGSRHSQSAMPYHEVLVLFASHLGVELLAGQVGVDVAFEVARVPLRMCLGGVNTVDILGKTGLHLGVLRRRGGIVRTGQVEVVVATVGARHVGDVPNGVGTGGVEYRATRKGVGIAAHILGAVALQRVGVVAVPRTGRLVPHGGVQRVGTSDAVEVVALRLPLCRDGVVGDGVGQTSTINADGRLEQHANLVVELSLAERHVLTTA